MAEAGTQPQTAMEGDALLTQLREGWSPLPTKTVFALVLGGLRVRMMRSVVTMMSIVFAIAFLTYTGLTNQLTYNVASAAISMEKFTPVPFPEVEAAVALMRKSDPLQGLTQDQKLEMGEQLGLARIDRMASDLPNLTQKLRIAKSTFDTMGAELAKLSADPKAGRADLNVARSRLDLATRELQTLQQQHDLVSRQVAIGTWIRTRQAPPADSSVPAQLDTALRDRYLQLVDLFRSPSQIEMEEMRPLRLLLDQSVQKGMAVNPLLQTLSQESTKRGAADLRNMLRRAGVNIEMTLRGNPLDTWLITMAMLTCAVGIANAMLMSVTERFREIGTMKCLGAQDGLVVKLFLLESAFLGVVGALMGIVMGLVVALLAALLQYGSFGTLHFPVTQGLKVVGLSVVGGIVLAVVGAVYPAFAASRMKPVDALRVDE